MSPMKLIHPSLLFPKTLCLILLISFSMAAQNKWYLSPTGSGNQDGTSRANARLYTNHSTLPIQPGDTVYFVQGTYTQQLLWAKSGSPAGLITLMPDPQNNGDVVFTVNDYAIDIRNRSYLRLFKLKMRNSAGGVTVGQGKVKFLDSLHISRSAGTGIHIYGNNGGSYNPAYDPRINSNVDSVFIRWCYIATDTQVTAQTDVISGYWLHGIRVIGNYLLQGNYTGDGHNDVIQFGHGVGDVYIANNIMINLKESNSQIFMNGNSWAGSKTVIYNNIAIHYGAGVGMWQTHAYNGWNINNSTLADIRDGEVYAIHNTLIGKRALLACMMGPVDSVWQSTAALSYDSVYVANNIFYMIQSDGTAPLTLPRRATDSYSALYVDNNIHAINGGISWAHISGSYGYLPSGNWTLSGWNNVSTMKMLNSTTSLPSFNNFQYNSSLYNQEDLRLTQNSVGVNAGRSDIKIKGNQWVNLKTLIESFGLEWKGFDNPYVSWSNPVPRSETNPTIGAWEYTDGSGGNSAPNPPTNPSPQNGATGQSTSLTLSWTCTDPDGDPLTYDVYFGTNNNPPLVSQDRQITNYSVNNLSAGATYYWRVVAKDNQGTSRSGNVWSFTTALTDTIPPRLIGASLVDNVTLSLTFSENINPTNATNINNFSINNGIQVNNAVLNGANIRLTTTAHSPGFYQVTVNNVTDLAGNIISHPFNTHSYGYNPDTLLNTIKFTPFNANASSVPDPNLTPTKTFDGMVWNSGDPNTRWAAVGLPQWIGYDLGDVRILNKTRVQFYRFQDRTYQYSIQVSTDSVNWSEVRTNISSVMGAEWDEHVLEPTPARYIRIIVNNNSAQNNWASVWESEFYGQLMVGNDDKKNIPTGYVLGQNYPNPFNPTTKISWQSPVGSHQTLKVYDLLGNEVETLIDEYKEPGRYEVEFNANNIASGVYFYKLQAGVFTEVKKMILMR
uniref:T9SS type A sorting domain-containing protein n=1 Tax=Ignavibacterium album TaxID=591197 RepID=A0A7V2ZI98_9BACT